MNNLGPESGNNYIRYPLIDLLLGMLSGMDSGRTSCRCITQTGEITVHFMSGIFSELCCNRKDGLLIYSGCAFID